jgi:AcrR family transcriptional regulator
VPKTRHDVDREDKVAEIVEVARRQVLDGGFGALSMAAIARELGVAQNAVYWYFPSRDHLFVAVLRHLMDELAARKPPTLKDHVDRAVWMVNRLADLHPLIVALHERAKASDVVAEFHREVEGIVRGMVAHALTGHVPDAEMPVAVESFIATVEGVLLRQLPRRQRGDVVRYTLERLSGRR